MDITQNIYQNKFWIQIMDEHARIIQNALVPKETSFLEEANVFIQQFDELLTRANGSLTDEQLKQLNQDAYKAVQDIRKYKLQILRRQLSGDLIIHYTPAFINHLVNEAEEFLDILWSYMNNKDPYLSSSHLNALWLQNGMRHSVLFSDTIDFNLDDRRKALNFANEFTYLYLTALETTGFLRTGLTHYQAEDQLNEDAFNEMKTFAEFLVDLHNQTMEHKVLGSINSLLVDHTYREMCYYLLRLSEVSKIQKPACQSTGDAL